MPKLPSADRILPYLRRIDATRYYSNHGPLVIEFERRLCEHFGAASGTIVSVTNGTLAIELALRNLDLPAGSLCMVPAWTFSATAHAVISAGLEPWFVDVAEQTWSLTPELAAEALRRAPGRVRAIVPVAPFGAPCAAADWSAFAREHDCAVVLDAAASFDSVAASDLTTIVSLHATKLLSSGEGGIVLCGDIETARNIKRRGNFGLLGDREAHVPGTNAKMPEYAAAVGLASLDEWGAIRASFLAVAAAYRARFAGTNVELQEGFGTNWISSTANVRLPEGTLERVEDRLGAAGIGTRRWWGAGVAAQRAFAGYPRTALPVTERLGASILGLPCWSDLSQDTIDAIARLVIAETRS